MKCPLAACLASVLAVGCVRPQAHADAATHAGVHSMLVQGMVQAAERAGGVSHIQLAPGLPPQIAAAAAALRPTRPAASTQAAGLPERHLLLQRASIGEHGATLMGRLGPVPRPGVGLACGTGLTVTFTRDGARWKQGDLQVQRC